MRSLIIGTEGRSHSSRAKGYRSNGLHNLRKEDRATRSLQPVRHQSPHPDCRTSTATQRSPAIPSAFPDRIRSSEHRAQHWNQRGRFGLYDGDRTTSNPSRLGINNPLQSQTDSPGDVDQGTNYRGRSLGERNLSPDTSGLVTRTGMGRRLRPSNPSHPCKRQSSCKALL